MLDCVLQRTPVGRRLHGKEHSINISSINKYVQTHRLKNTNLLLFTETVINTKGSEIYSLYYGSHISQEKQSAFVENSPSFKDVNFQTHTQIPKERTHIIIFHKSRSNRTTPKRAQLWRTNRNKPTCVNYFTACN